MNIISKSTVCQLQKLTLAKNEFQLLVVKLSSSSKSIKSTLLTGSKSIHTTIGFKPNIPILQGQHQFKINLTNYQHKHLSMVKLKSLEKFSGSGFHNYNSNSGSKRSIKSLTTIKSIDSGIKMRVLPIRALQDNYMYLLIDDATRQAAAVDPVNASAMANAVSDQEVELKAIITTHHHYDHANGNSEMLDMFPDLLVYGGDNRVQALNKMVEHGEMIKLGTLNIECLSTPCHTRGHICYYVTLDNSDPSDNERVVFTGDTLFIAGCGRFFEGSPEQMDRNLNSVLGNLPENTKVYCGHEYTVANLKFALSVEPQNIDIKSKLAWAQNKVLKREATVPSTIGEEKKINPFMRLKEPQVKKYTGEQDELEVMSMLRHKKNEFRA